MLLSISEIINKACKLKTKQEKVEWLKANNSVPLRNILILMYDKKFNIMLPDTPPPYTPSEYLDSQGMLYKQARKLVYFVEGMKGDLIDTVKREKLFIEMLESVDKGDAELLCKMIAQKPLKGLTAATINEAFGDIISTAKSKENG
jgi:hypothetical protein